MPDFLIHDEVKHGELVEVNFNGGSHHSFIPKLVSTMERPLCKAGPLFTELIMKEFDCTEL